MERDKGIHKASGRILFQIGTGHYICSGTLVQGPNDRAVIATAAHCLYDQATNVFASNVLFIPGQVSRNTPACVPSWDPVSCVSLTDLYRTTAREKDLTETAGTTL
jgi:hypothetical protein